MHGTARRKRKFDGAKLLRGGSGSGAVQERHMILKRPAARAAVASILAVVLGSAASARTMIPEDLTRAWNAEDATISHDGKTVAFVEMRVDAKKNAYRRDIWLVPVAGGEARQLTRGDEDSDPQWMPGDRTIVFTSGRPGKAQIYRISLDGGEAEKLTDAPDGATSPRISHDGTHIAFRRTIKDKPGKTGVDWSALGMTPSERARTSDVRHIDVLHFELNGAGDTFADHSHLFVMNADGGGQKQLTSGRFDEGDAAWSPDDRTIVFDSARHSGNDFFRQDLYAVASSGGPERRIALSHLSAQSPVFTHDGRVAYQLQSRNDPAGLPAIAVASLDGTKDATIVPEDRHAIGDAVLADVIEGGAGCGPIFTPDDGHFFADVSEPGKSVLERFDTATGAAVQMNTGDGEVADCSADTGRSEIAYTYDDATHPPEVYVLDATTGATRQLTHLNAGFLGDVSLATIEPFSVTDRAGFPVSAWIMRPPGAVEGRRYPTLLEIHGGPETEYGNAYFQEFQVLAARGYNVVFADPRGSVGFGYPFESALSKNWGDPMFEDEMAVVDAAVKRPDVDPKRLGVLGGSYGGYATLWIVGHTNRFKAAIAERAVSDLTSEAFGSDFASIPDAKLSWGAPWDDPLTYRRQSPLTYVAHVRTPMLMIHSDQDIRTPVDQTYEEYTALKALGRDVSLVEFPRENHDLSRTGEPLHRIERLHLIADYFKARL